MANEKADGGRIKRITFAMPPEMIFAIEALAAAEYCNVSAICRQKCLYLQAQVKASVLIPRPNV
jgi:hypothetical protein